MGHVCRQTYPAASMTSSRDFAAFIALFLPLLLAPQLHGQAPGNAFSFDNAQAFSQTYCESCHQGARAPGRLDLTQYNTRASVKQNPESWGRVLRIVREGAMPPRGMPGPDMGQREQFSTWLESTLHEAVCAAGPTPGPAPVRRLNRSQYTRTIRDLLNIQFNAGHALPEDGAGGEGFDNAAETLFLSPIHAEKYLEAAKESLAFAFKDPRAREVVVAADPGPGVSPEQAAQETLARFLPRAFRRPAKDSEIDEYLALFRAAQKRGDTYDGALSFVLQAVLLSPQFLFRIEEPNPAAAPRLLNDFALASRLSYFLWNSMPDQELLDLAAAGKLNDPETLQLQVDRMIRREYLSKEDDVRRMVGSQVEAFAEEFIQQWLKTRELGRDIQPDRELFPEYYETELQSAIRYEPVLFFKELLIEDLSLLNFLHSDFSMLDRKLASFYGLKLKGPVGAQPSKQLLPENSRRGGVLGMAAVLAVTSYHNRTSPVLRGTWILENLLGMPPPPPPPNVPELEEATAGPDAKTLRQRLEQHRANSACAACHDRIDPLGFALENYGVLGKWRDEEGGAPVDAKGELPDGTTFNGPEEFKAVLLQRKDVFIGNFTRKVLAYALGRGLTLQDSCTVDEVVAQLQQNDYKAKTLIKAIVLSAPFRYQAGTDTKLAVHRQEKVQ